MPRLALQNAKSLSSLQKELLVIHFRWSFQGDTVLSTTFVNISLLQAPCQ
jgi:hypothetical protein